MSVTHSFVSAKTDGADTSVVRPSDWNDDHVLTNIVQLIGLAYYDEGGVDRLLGSVSNTTPVDVDATNLSVTFTVPASGKVLVVLTGFGVLTSGFTPYVDLRESSTVIATRAFGFFGGGNQSGYRTLKFKITGLTPGASHTYKWSNHTDGGGTFGIEVGPTYGAATIEVWDNPYL